MQKAPLRRPTSWEYRFYIHIRKEAACLDRYLLKNIIILILVLVNGFLLGALTVRQTAEERSRRQAEEQLVELFAADSISLDPDASSDEVSPPALFFLRSTEREREAAGFFLGDDLTEENQGGGISTYTGAAGTATFRSNGSFDIKGTLASKDTEALCQAFCRTFSYGQPAFLLDQDGSGSGSAVYRHNKLPVFNCTVTFTLENGILTSVSGTLLPKEGSVSTETREPLTAPAALITFQKAHRESGAVGSAITEMYACYELQSAASSALSLVPAWCVVTDITNYYVNAITGTVTAG